MENYNLLNVQLPKISEVAETRIIIQGIIQEFSQVATNKKKYMCLLL